MSSLRATFSTARSQRSSTRCSTGSLGASAPPNSARFRPMTSSSSNSTRRLGEFALIAKLFAPLSVDDPAAFALTDDAATMTPPDGHDLVVTKDMLVEGVHFLRDDPPELVARKALRVNLSDLAAKGAQPKSYLLGLSLAPWIDDGWLTAFAAGLAEDQKRFAV